MATADLKGLRVLLVEDEFFVALAMEEVLRAQGYEVVGPAMDVPRALDLVRAEAIDAAILDVNLNGRPVFPVAEALAERGIGFVFATGYGATELPDSFRSHPRLRKPFQARDLVSAIAGMVRSEPTAVPR